MSDREWERELRESRRRAESEAREAWHRARDEMREAFRRAHEEQHNAAQGESAYADDLNTSFQELADSARDLGREIGDEARRLATDFSRSAKHEWHSRWRDQWQKYVGHGGKEHWMFGGRRFRQWNTGDEEANPFVSSILSRGGGLLALYCLHLLAQQPRHGNDIMRQIEQRTMGSWTSNPGAVYPLLSMLEENGFVQSKWEDPDKRTRRIYHITAAGKQELDSLRRLMRPKVMEAIEVLQDMYDDLYGADDEDLPPSEPPVTPASGTDVSGADGSGGTTETPPQDQQTDQQTNQQAESSHSELDENVGAPDFDDRDWRGRLNRLFGRGHQQSFGTTI
jgi:DNA-binding PadR family transcriptional regulator